MIPGSCPPPRVPLPGLRLALLAGLLWAGGLDGQESTWNGPEVLRLVEGARQVRQASAVDSTLQGYRARAQGFVYFFLDRPEEEEHTLIKADQLAVEVYWQAPDRTRQRIVGMRDEEVLPTNIRYHLDHLTVVQDDFGDLIRLGEGDEVAAVVHPVSPGAETVYDYRLGATSTLSYPGIPEPIRVQRIQVRPRNPNDPGFVGTLYVDRGSSAIVRMTFTFTAASYVDPYLAHIRISLDNSLWLGKHWLPYRQEVEIRRELPQLDFMAGSIIRGRWEIGSYEFNPETPVSLFRGPRVTALPASVRERYPFEDDLFSDLEERGLAASPELDAIRDQARAMAVEDALQGLAPFRLHFGSVSDAVRRNRVEGWAFGLGATLRPGARPIRILGGYATGARRPWGRIESEVELGGGTLDLAAHWNRTVDLGPRPGLNGLFNTIATLGGRDYTDLYWTSGADATWRLPLGSRRELRLSGTVEDVRSGRLNIDDEDTTFRPVLPVTEGRHAVLEMGLGRDDDGDGSFWELAVRGGTLGREYLAADTEVGWSRRGPARPLDLHLSLSGGWVGRGAPPQELHLLGGLGTLPGFPYRGAVGDRFVLARSWVRGRLLDPWVSLRGSAAAGWSRLADRSLPEGWVGDPDPGVRGSVGVGLDLLWEVIQLDVARGLPDGDWTFFVSVTPRFHPWL